MSNGTCKVTECDRLVKSRGWCRSHYMFWWHWAYDHRDPNEKTDQRGYVYSLDADHYRPMCVPCHKRFDLNRLNGTQFEQFA